MEKVKFSIGQVIWSPVTHAVMIGAGLGIAGLGIALAVLYNSDGLDTIAMESVLTNSILTDEGDE